MGRKDTVSNQGIGVHDGVLEAIGNTPLIRFRRLLPEAKVHLYGKLEALNPGGSIKDRPALAILTEALADGSVRPGDVVVESSSGNMGVGLAQACRYHGLRFICVVDPKTAEQNLKVLRAYGAEIDYVGEPDPESGEFLQARLKRVESLVRELGNAFWPNQYANRNNPAAHYRTTMSEIVTALDGEVDYVFAATSTCGTIRGCGEYIRDHVLATRLIAVDAVGSLIFSDVKSYRRIPGLGAGLRPPLCDVDLIHECIHVDDLDCVLGCRRLVAREAILAGGSSGGVVAAVMRALDRLPDGSRCVIILPDRGERYLDTIYNDDWVRQELGDVDDRLREAQGEERWTVPVS